MQHRISAGALVLREHCILLARHRVSEKYDFWAPPGGTVEDNEELAVAAEREAHEETGITIRVARLADIDELIDDSGRMLKFWYAADYVSGEIDISRNPAESESIIDAGWFSMNSLPAGNVFPLLLRDTFWKDLMDGFSYPRKLPLQFSIF